VRVGNAPWGKAPSLLTAKQLELQVALLPLLRRHFELVRVNLVEPVITLETNRDGQLNWEPGARRARRRTGDQSSPGALPSAPFDHAGCSPIDGAGGETVAIDELALSSRDVNSPIEVNSAAPSTARRLRWPASCLVRRAFATVSGVRAG
jgi:hypothetical protein